MLTIAKAGLLTHVRTKEKFMLMSAKSKILFVSLFSVLFLMISCKKGSEKAAVTSEFKTENEKVSYILGYSTGKSLNEQSVDIGTDIFMRGMQDGLDKSDKKPAFTDAQMRETMQAFRTSLMEKHRKEREAKGAANLAEGEKFLAANKAKEKVVTLPSGLQYEVVTQGTGEIPKADDTVTVEYEGSSLDGKVFDSTKERGQPASFPVRSTVPGMSEALKLMPVGSKWKLYVPASLAYGEQGAGAKIAPNQTLVFDLHLISTKTPEKAAEKDLSKTEKKASEVKPIVKAKPTASKK